MFGRRITLFKLVGFEVGIDMSWLILAVLITWSLAAGYFPHYYGGLSPSTYWWMGVAGAIGLFISIIFHELSHSLVARRYGIPMKGITLFIFGGVAHMEDEPPSAKSEFLMAIAGPISSIILGLGFYALSVAGDKGGFSGPFTAVFSYLGFINLILAGFNLLPAFPLDGGRVLRSILWSWKNNLKWGTRVAAKIGLGFGAGFIILGIFSFLTGNFIGGMWWALIGLFLRHASNMSYQQISLRQAFEGEKVERFMKSDPVTVGPSLSVEDLIENYFYKHHHKMFPVVEDDSKLIGCVTSRNVGEVPKEDWHRTTVGQIAGSCSSDNTTSPGTDAMRALSTMRRTGNGRLLVLDNGRLVGILTLKDMMDFLSLKLDLENY